MTGVTAPHPDCWPDPHDRTCDDCGHVWFAGERRHEYADPTAARPEDSDVICILCVQKRQARAADL
jgi:hypothetical protein